MQFDTNELVSFMTNWSVVLPAIVTTILMAILAQLLGIVLGLVAALAGRSRNIAVHGIAAVYVWIFRGTPVLVQIMLLYFGVPALLGGADPFPNTYPFLPAIMSGPFVAAMLALGVNEGAYMSEIIRAGILSVDAGQAEAAKSLGMTPRKTMSRIVLPQAMRVIIPPLGNEFNNMLKTTSLASMITVTELVMVAQMRYAGTFKPFEPLVGISLYYLAMTTVWGFVQSRIERKLVVGLARSDDEPGFWARTLSMSRGAPRAGGMR